MTTSGGRCPTCTQRRPAELASCLRAPRSRIRSAPAYQLGRDVSALQAATDQARHHQRQRRLPGLLRDHNFASGGLYRRQQGERQPQLLRQPAVPGPQQCHRRRGGSRTACGTWSTPREGAPAPVFTGQCSRTRCCPPARDEEEPFLFTDSNGAYNVFVRRSSTARPPILVWRARGRTTMPLSEVSSWPARPPDPGITAAWALGRASSSPWHLQLKPAHRRQPPGTVFWPGPGHPGAAARQRGHGRHPTTA